MQTLSLRGVEMAFVDRGVGPLLLLVHGFPLDHRMWAEQIAVLSERYRVVAPDLRGFGQSGPAPDAVTMRAFADDLAALCEALAPGKPIVLAGLSMGGYIGLAFWNTYSARLRGLVLCDTRAAADSNEGAAARNETADRVLREGPTCLAETMLPRLLAPGSLEARPPLRQQLQEIIASGNPRGLAAALRGMARRSDYTCRLAEIACPTLLVVGQQDVFSTPTEMAALALAIPAACLVEIDDAGHLTPLEQPAAFNAALLDFLDGLPG